ncbi:hypothetical protein EVAR_54685_1 [Eumeta japonica]|uniref:Uncharacterized protein n=1 Tax=Eumeta variegata TaxID=151549 RepID=A0A4C1X565_EUMVA|nr:hypothetical protein EVAR_54685_1 [Eumeta japonica]
MMDVLKLTCKKLENGFCGTLKFIIPPGPFKPTPALLAPIYCFYEYEVMNKGQSRAEMEKNTALRNKFQIDSSLPQEDGQNYSAAPRLRVNAARL